MHGSGYSMAIVLDHRHHKAQPIWDLYYLICYGPSIGLVWTFYSTASQAWTELEACPKCRMGSDVFPLIWEG